MNRNISQDFAEKNNFIKLILVNILLQRSIALFIALVASFFFRFHIMVWTVFMPKMLYEIVHFSINSLFVFIAYFIL